MKTSFLTKTKKYWNIQNICAKKTAVFSLNIKENGIDNGNLLDGNLFHNMDSSAHHDIFALIIASNKLAASPVGDNANFFSLIFVFAHCAWLLLLSPGTLLKPLDTLH